MNSATTWATIDDEVMNSVTRDCLEIDGFQFEESANQPHQNWVVGVGGGEGKKKTRYNSVKLVLVDRPRRCVSVGWATRRKSGRRFRRGANLEHVRPMSVSCRGCQTTHRRPRPISVSRFTAFFLFFCYKPTGRNLRSPLAASAVPPRYRRQRSQIARLVCC